MSNLRLQKDTLPPSPDQVPSMEDIVVEGHQPDWDPDIVANVLEDDLIAEANGPATAVAQEESLEDDQSESSSKDCDSVGGFQFSDDGDQSFFGHDGRDINRSKLTQYSFTSAVSNCPEEFQTFNDRFEKSNVRLQKDTLPASPDQVTSMEDMVVEGPQPDWDPDIVATVDDDIIYEDPANVLEDDLIAEANGPATAVAQEEFLEDDQSESGSADCDSVGGFQFPGDGDQSVSEHDGRDKKMSKLSQYTLISAVSNCTELNDKSQKVQDCGDSIVAVEPPKITGSILLDYLLANHQENVDYEKRLYEYKTSDDEELKKKTVQLAQRQKREKKRLVEVAIDEPLKHNAQSILSTYSNKVNLPKLIEVEKKRKPEKMPAAPNETEEQLDLEISLKENDGPSNISENNETTSIPWNFRPKNETTEERKRRKQGAKQRKRETRERKKSNRKAN